MKEKLYITDSNGVVIDEIESGDSYAKLSDGDKILRKGSIFYLQETTDIKYKFIKVNPVLLAQYCNKYSILPFLISSIGYMDNICSYSNGRIIKIKDLPKLCNKSEITIKRQLKGLVDDDVLHKVRQDKTMVMMINPWIAMRGRRIYLSTYEEFKLSALRSEIEEVGK